MNILNKRSLDVNPVGSVYVGRPSEWGNHFVIGKDGNRDEVIDKFKKWAWHPEQFEWRCRVRSELKGKNLICWCAPYACHASVLVDIANA